MLNGCEGEEEGGRGGERERGPLEPCKCGSSSLVPLCVDSPAVAGRHSAHTRTLAAASVRGNGQSCGPSSQRNRAKYLRTWSRPSPTSSSRIVQGSKRWPYRGRGSSRRSMTLRWPHRRSAIRIIRRSRSSACPRRRVWISLCPRTTRTSWTVTQIIPQEPVENRTENVDPPFKEEIAEEICISYH